MHMNLLEAVMEGIKSEHSLSAINFGVTNLDRSQT